VSKAHANLLAAAVHCAKAKAALDASGPTSADRARHVDELHRRTWALRSAAVAFSKTAMGREIAEVVNDPLNSVDDKDSAQ
jgi:hypothetical protein